MNRMKIEQWQYFGMCLDKMFGVSGPKREGYGVREKNSTVQKSPEAAALTVPENAAFEGSTPLTPTTKSAEEAKR